jgi:hypothetical protein
VEGGVPAGRRLRPRPRSLLPRAPPSPKRAPRRLQTPPAPRPRPALPRPKGIKLRDVVAACAAGYLQSTPLLDLNYEEDSGGGPDIAVAYQPGLDKIVLLQARGARRGLGCAGARPGGVLAIGPPCRRALGPQRAKGRRRARRCHPAHV